jgi:hypothetical protein
VWWAGRDLNSRPHGLSITDVSAVCSNQAELPAQCLRSSFLNAGGVFHLCECIDISAIRSDVYFFRTGDIEFPFQ